MIFTLVSSSSVDTDKHQRDVVRKKLEGYLKHAEELHEKYLSTPEGNSVVQVEPEAMLLEVWHMFTLYIHLISFRFPNLTK